MSGWSVKTAYASAAAAGALLWVAASVLSGRTEAWDSSLYWLAAYPVGIVVSGFAGFMRADRAWRWGLTLMLAQAITLASMTFSFGLLPLGLIVFGVLAVPTMLAARLGAWIRGRLGVTA